MIKLDAVECECVTAREIEDSTNEESSSVLRILQSRGSLACPCRRSLTSQSFVSATSQDSILQLISEVRNDDGLAEMNDLSDGNVNTSEQKTYFDSFAL